MWLANFASSVSGVVAIDLIPLRSGLPQIYRGLEQNARWARSRVNRRLKASRHGTNLQGGCLVSTLRLPRNRCALKSCSRVLITGPRRRAGRAQGRSRAVLFVERLRPEGRAWG